MSASIFLAKTETQVSETAGTVQIEIRRTGSLAGDVTILYGIQDDTATFGQDHSGAGGTIVMPDGAASVLVPITILNDAVGEPTEVFTLSLISVSAGSLVAPRTHRISILDDETPAPPPPTEPPLVSDWVVTRDPVLSGLPQPVRFTFSPLNPDLMFIAEKGGTVRLANIETGATQLVLNLVGSTNAHGDRGLLDVALHPDLVNHPYLYVFRVVDPPETAGQAGNIGPDGAGNRYSHLERYTLDAATGYTTVVPGSGTVILGNAGQSLSDISGGGALDFTNPAFASELSSERIGDAGDVVIGGYKQNYLKVDSASHAGGRLLFGPDGMLYVLTGDGTSPNYADPHSVEVQSLDTLSGKVLRIDPITGQGLADNPFAAGAADLDANRAKIWQYGLRNPFSAVFDAEGKLIIADVGWNTYEEINTAGPGANFGWPFYEGADGAANQTNGYRDLPEAAAFYAAVAAGDIEVTLPFRAFNHDFAAPGFQLQSITSGGVVLPGTVYDPSLIGQFLFSDFVGGDAYLISTADRQDVNYLFDWGDFGPVHMVQGPDGYIWYADIVVGQIGRLDIDPVGVAQGQELRALGSATLTSPATGTWTLTPDGVEFQLGAVGAPTRIDLRQDASFSFEMFFGSKGPDGADGAAFSLHAAGWGSLGAPGGGLGVAGLANSLAVEFDTWAGPGDIANDHTVIYAPTQPGFGTGVNGIVDLGNIEDGAWHAIRIVWNAASQTITTFFDGVQRDSKTADLIAAVFGGQPYVNFMWTAATGGATNLHQIRGIVADVTYEDVPGAQAPVLFGGPSRSFEVAENTLAAFHTPQATDAEGDTLTWRIAGGPDAARFAINAATGALAFAIAPDFEMPADAGADNVYDLVIEVADPGGLTATQAVSVRVTDVADESPAATEGPDLILGLPGTADLIRGLGGADTVFAGAGADTILATVNDGDDFYHGGAGGNDLYDISATSADAQIAITGGLATSAQIGADTLRSIEHATGGAGNDVITGNAATNKLTGLNGNDSLRGNDGDDLLIGGAGDDSLNGNNGADEMYGGLGNDIYVVNESEDMPIEFANEGADTVLSSVSWTLGEHFETLALIGTLRVNGTGHAGNETLIGNNNDNLLRGLTGNDSLGGGGGADTLVGGAGADTMIGGPGADVFLYGLASDGGDVIRSYIGAEDTISVSAAGFGGGLAAGMNLVTTGRYVENLTGEATAPAGTGQFIYETDTRILRWDADGIGAGAAVVIATLINPTGWSGAEIVVIA